MVEEDGLRFGKHLMHELQDDEFRRSYRGKTDLDGISSRHPVAIGSFHRIARFEKVALIPFEDTGSPKLPPVPPELIVSPKPNG